MRAYLFLIFAVGLFASLAGQFRPHSSAHLPDAAQQAFDGNRQEIADFKARNAPQFTGQDGTLELQRSEDGQFYADVRINNSAYVHMMVDTGASTIALSRDDAQAAGIATSIGMNDVVGEGADGAVHGEYAQLESVELGPLTARGLDAVILGNGNQSLLGQSFLSKYDSVQIQGDTMILRKGS